MQTAVRLAVMASVVARSCFVTVQRNRDAVTEDRQNGADWNGDRAHRPDVNPNRDAKGRSARRRDGSTEAWNDANREQECWRTDRKPLHPRREPMQILFEAPELGGVPVDPVAEQRSADQSEDVDQGSSDGAEDGAVHNGKGIGHRKRR